MLPAFRIAGSRVDPSLHTITGPAGPIRLEPKVLHVLTCLAERAGDVVEKDRFKNAVWAGTFVSDDVLARAISGLRRAFGDDARRPRVIQTVPKEGYRLIAPVTWEPCIDAPHAARVIRGEGRRKRGTLGGVVLALGAALALAGTAFAGLKWARRLHSSMRSRRSG